MDEGQSIVSASPDHHTAGRHWPTSRVGALRGFALVLGAAVVLGNIGGGLFVAEPSYAARTLTAPDTAAPATIASAALPTTSTSSSTTTSSTTTSSSTSTTLPATPTVPDTAVAPTTVPAALAPVSPICLADAAIEPDERGLSVACLQRRLTELGLFHGAISGLYDLASQQAVRAFQHAHPPLKADGLAGARTLMTLAIWSGSTNNANAVTGPGPFPAAPRPNEPQWNLTADGIPFYGNHEACDATAAAVIAAEFANDGADVDTQQWAVYIASRESGCRFDAVTVNARTRDDSQCAFQLNALSGTFAPSGELGRRGWSPEATRFSMQSCADAASDLWVVCGRGPWIKPYSCVRPWLGSTDGQPAPALPVVPAPATVADPTDVGSSIESTSTIAPSPTTV